MNQRMISQAERKHRFLRLGVGLATAWCGLLPARAAGQAERVDFEAAAATAPRLSAPAFAELPASVAAALRENQCTVPQYRYEGDSSANNLISGEFARAGQLDHAALCSRDGRTSLLVVWGGPARCGAVTRTADDVNAMVGAGNELLYARQIRRVARSEAQEFAWLQSGGLPQVEHDGILHSVGEYQTSFLYCRDGEWIEIEPEATT